MNFYQPSVLMFWGCFFISFFFSVFFSKEKETKFTKMIPLPPVVGTHPTGMHSGSKIKIVGLEIPRFVFRTQEKIFDSNAQQCSHRIPDVKYIRTSAVSGNDLSIILVLGGYSPWFHSRRFFLPVDL